MNDTSVDGLRGTIAALTTQLDTCHPDCSDADRIDLIAELETLKNTITAHQMIAAAAFARSQQADQHTRGVPTSRSRRGIADQIALALRQSPHRGSVFLGVATVLTREMPHTLAAVRAGVLDDYRARLLVQETACLTGAHRAEIDRQLCSDHARLHGVGTRRLVNMARRAAYQAEPAAVVERAAHAESERFVSVRPAPDQMVWLTALLPLTQGVACYAALRQAADTTTATGDPRGRGQIMADTLVTRLTGQTTPDAIPVALHLVMPADTLLSGDSEPGRILGHGPIPAALARRLVTAAPPVQSWIRRLYTDPRGGLIAMETRSRHFPPGLAEFITIRDDTCRTPYCDAPIRHHDHVLPYHLGGATSAHNGQGLCQRCNHAKQAPGWTSHPVLIHEHSTLEKTLRQTILTTTPTGHTTSSPPHTH